METPFKNIPEQRKDENYHEKWTSKNLKSRKNTRITARNPFQTLSRAPQTNEKRENYRVEEPETAKIHIQNLTLATGAKPKLRKFTYKTNMQARNHENSYGFRPPHRSSHPAFYPYPKNPKC